jgi:hypothetical protein
MGCRALKRQERNMTWKHAVGIFAWWALVALAACEPATPTVSTLVLAGIGASLTLSIWPTIDRGFNAVARVLASIEIVNGPSVPLWTGRSTAKRRYLFLP